MTETYIPKKAYRDYSPLAQQMTAALAVWNAGAMPSVRDVVGAVRLWQRDAEKRVGESGIAAVLDNLRLAYDARPDAKAVRAHAQKALDCIKAAEDGTTPEDDEKTKRARATKAAAWEGDSVLKADTHDNPSPAGEPDSDEWDVQDVEGTAGKGAKQRRTAQIEAAMRQSAQQARQASAIVGRANEGEAPALARQYGRDLIADWQKNLRTFPELSKVTGQVRFSATLNPGGLNTLLGSHPRQLARNAAGFFSSIASGYDVLADFFGSSAYAQEFVGRSRRSASKPAWLEAESPRLARMFEHIVDSCQRGDVTPSSGNCYSYAMGRVQRERSWSGMSKAQKRAFKRWAGQVMRAKGNLNMAGTKLFPVENMSPMQVQRLVREDFDRSISTDVAQDIINADRHGTLLWTGRHLITTDASRIHIVPARGYDPEKGADEIPESKSARGRKQIRNLWRYYETSQTQVSEDSPGSGWWPVVNERRVRGSNYTPYGSGAGSPAWVREANRLLADHARSNFERR